MKAIGVTIKAVLQVDENLAGELRRVPGSFLRLTGRDLDNLKIGVRPGVEVEPARLWVRVENLALERQDEFLEE